MQNRETYVAGMSVWRSTSSCQLNRAFHIGNVHVCFHIRPRSLYIWTYIDESGIGL
jgi:hypothetical protein